MGAIPPGLEPALATWATGVEQRISDLETPPGFVAAFLTTKAGLTAANAAEGNGRFAILTDLKTFAWSDGSHWWRADTGAQIV